MEKTVKVTMSIDSELKRQAELLCKDMGLSLSTAYTMLLKAIVRTRSI
ncbi:type II toxin-antitoxin system RelB/DinJ family antitoxin, partial [bacterium]|nr:type II toxin-antitoxin system RelB/DinJ family antitoxin [bacterium]